MACLRLFTFLPLPDLSVPFLRRRIALATRFDAAFPYLRPPEGFLAAISLSEENVFAPIAAVSDNGLAHVVPENPWVRSDRGTPRRRRQ